MCFCGNNLQHWFKKWLGTTITQKNAVAWHQMKSPGHELRQWQETPYVVFTGETCIDFVSILNNWVNIGSGNGLVPEPMLTYHYYKEFQLFLLFTNA